jgi:hypothetical protein
VTASVCQRTSRRTVAVLAILAFLPALALAATLTDTQIRQKMIAESIAAYPGRCPCPHIVASNGSHSGKRSAWSKAGGYAPLYYPAEVSDEAVKAWLQKHGAAQ